MGSLPTLRADCITSPCKLQHFGGSRCDELDAGRDQYFNSAALVLHRHEHALQSRGVFPGSIATLGHTQSFNAEDAESFAEAAEAKPEYFLCVPLRKTLRPLRLSWKLVRYAPSLTSDLVRDCLHCS